MKKPQPGRAGGEVRIADLKAQLLNMPPTKRRGQALDHLRIAESRVDLVTAILGVGVDEPPIPVIRKPTRVSRLREGLESGTFTPPNSPGLLADLSNAAAGDREAQQRVISYLQTPGVLEALGD